MGENSSFSNFLPNELEINPNLEVNQNTSKSASKYYQPSLFDFIYETGEIIIQKINISQPSEDIIKNIENEIKQKSFEQD
ncbi:hypothetical protein CHLV4142_06150 [Campylobacter helveticus]|uniref:Uncharacterized protein n=1 Tax=Campylobacter helveticus TaxID=28898 RepID=A0ABY3KZ68_9BACT|nr:hypothetical protein [Campylobacter helveticus]MCR2039731.1 hypothetical protein [Campylobacter helveticus]MCR2060347.1 hypothetical protein [Campylobacter helveticus]TXK53774.1 hypothetical protein FVD16_10130 [Campylobacter helveticus]